MLTCHSAFSFWVADWANRSYWNYKCECERECVACAACCSGEAVRGREGVIRGGWQGWGDEEGDCLFGWGWVDEWCLLGLLGRGRVGEERKEEDEERKREREKRYINLVCSKLRVQVPSTITSFYPFHSNLMSLDCHVCEKKTGRMDDDVWKVE